MNVTDSASHRRRDDRAKELVLWPAIKGTYLSLCEDGLISFDQKALGRLWDDYVRDMPEAIRARAMIGEL
jgi:hypothetical protein